MQIWFRHTTIPSLDGIVRLTDATDAAEVAASVAEFLDDAGAAEALTPVLMGRGDGAPPLIHGVYTLWIVPSWYSVEAASRHAGVTRRSIQQELDKSPPVFARDISGGEVLAGRPVEIIDELRLALIGGRRRGRKPKGSR